MTNWKEKLDRAEDFVDWCLNQFASFLSWLADSPFTIWVLVIVALIVTYLIYW